HLPWLEPHGRSDEPTARAVPTLPRRSGVQLRRRHDPVRPDEGGAGYCRGSSFVTRGAVHRPRRLRRGRAPRRGECRGARLSAAAECGCAHLSGRRERRPEIDVFVEVYPPSLTVALILSVTVSSSVGSIWSAMPPRFSTLTVKVTCVPPRTKSGP